MDIRQQITDLVVTYQRLEKARGYRNDDKGAAAATKEAEERCQAILVDLAATVLTDLHRIADAMERIAGCAVGPAEALAYHTKFRTTDG